MKKYNQKLYKIGLPATMRCFGQGFSLVEMLVVVGVFAVVSLIVTQSVLSSLRNTRKTDNQINVRENLNYITSVMERSLRNADQILIATSTNNLIRYINDQGDNTALFRCSGLGAIGRIESEKGQISSNDVDIETCNFTYTPAATGVPQKVAITISAKTSNTSALEESLITATTIISLRVY